MQEQFKLEGDDLILFVKKSPLVIRGVMFVFSFLFFILPITSIITVLVSGNGLHVGFLFGLVIFGLLGFYMLRMSLWNTYGNERVSFQGDKVLYTPDYGWFKTSTKEIDISNVEFFIRSIGYEDDQTGALLIKSNEEIRCATKMPNDQLNRLIQDLEKRYKK